ncbi:klarsicht protein isoform X2 [Eupeodes corollae]|uniref:klarsicht protein isoform X2 n=1 Tax=Eupeodes corollae TaxID=290404 RepID=UPI0024930FFE|nr:klarsicht protein isoform X2 [Eupeodes corollae]
MKAPATVINTNNNTNSTTSSNGGDESFCSSSNTNFMPISSVSEINNSTMDNTHHHHQQQQHPQPQQQQTPSFGSNNISTSNSGSGGLLMHHQTSASGSGTGDGPGASRINGVNITNNGNSNSGGGSYIKASLSMTSLPPDEQQEGREVIKAKLRVERPYNSLKKKRNTDRDTWRHSWGSGHSHSSCSLHSNATTGGIIGLVSGKDEFWAALQTNYNYIMDTNLLDTCKEARCEIEGAASITKNATENCLKMLDTSRSEGSSEDPKELRKWLREMESKLEEAPTLSEATQFGIEELQRRLDEHSVLYREIVSHARVVGACIKASEKKNNLASDEQQQQQNSSLSSTDEKSAGVGTGSAAGADTRGASDLVTGGKTPSPNSKETSSKQKSSNNEGNLKGLEHRYHLLYLKAIEVQCLFEGLLGKKISAANLLRSGGATTSEETDEEPASKLARLSDSESDDSTHSAEEHRVALRTTAECCKKAAKKSNCNKTDYADGDDEDDGEDEIDHPQSGHSTANWSSLSFNTVLTQERVHQCCITTSLASTDFDADSEGSDYEVVKRSRRSEKYPTSGVVGNSNNNYRCLLSTPVRNHNAASFNPFHSQLLSSENDSVFILSDSMDSKSLMQSKLLNGSSAGGAGELSKQSPQPLQQQHNSPKLLNISNHNITRLSPQQQQQQQLQHQNQLLLVNSKSGTAATSTVLTTSPCSNGGGGVSSHNINGNSNIGCTVGAGNLNGNGNTPVSNAAAVGIRKRHRNIDISKFNESNRKSNSCAIFYFKHLDTDNETNFSGGALSSSHGSDISKSAEPSSDDDEGWLYTNSAEHCIDGSHRQTKIVVNQEKSHHHHQHQHQHHHHSKANNSSSQLSTNDDSDKENKTGTAVTSILANNANSGGSSSNSNSNQTTPSIRSSSSLNSSSQIAITEIQLNGGGGSSNYSGSTTGSFIGCAATSTTVVMHRSVMELQLGSNNSISQGSSTNITSRSPNRSVQSNEHQFVDPTTPTKCYYSNFETNPVFNGRNVSPRTPKKSGNTVTTATFEVSSAKEVSHESIKQLVLGAEHLVRDDAMKTPTKQNQQQQKHSIVKISSTIKKREVIMPGPAKQRIEEWLEHQPVCIKQEPQVSSVPTTDCEASGEASETDSVARGSDSSEGFTDSVATCMQTTGGSNSYGNSIEHIGGSAEPIPTVGSNQSLNATSKVLRRQNRRKNDRPWSVSCLSQLTEANAQIGSKAQASQAGLATHSISESALDSLSPGRQRNDSQPNISVKNTESKNSLKRRKIRKKKQLAKKNESGSDGMLQIKKTESLSSGQTVQEITAALLNLPKSNLEAGEEQTLMKPNFRVGSYTTAYMTNENKLGSLAALATYMNEEDPQGEYTTGTEDHHSSFSETAWDNYQEKYNSENYSEGFDSDAARRLLEFGDDYRNFLDSQSDCCSSLSAANNLDSMSPPQMDSLKQNEAKVVIQETIVSSVDHARRRRALELEYERRRKNLEVRRKSCQDDIIQNIRSPTTSLSSSANALTPKNNEKFSFMARVDSATRKLDFGMSHSAQSLRRTSESDTSSRRRRADDRRRSSRNLEKSIKLIPATSSSSEEHTDDEKEMRNLLTQSKNRLEDTRSLKIRSHLLRPEDYAEIIATCRDNIRCLDSVLRGPPGTVMSAGCLNATKDLLSSWEELLAWSENAAAARKMQEEMIILKSSLNRLGGKLACDLDTEPSIQLSIEALKNEKSQLQTYRTNMLRLNASVHSWLTRQERKLAAELAEHEEAIKSATEATLQSSQTQQVPETSSGSNNENVTVDNSNKKSVGTIAFDQDKHSQITTIIQSESEFHKHLKNEVSEMYSAWDEANSRINNQLEVLTTSLIAWRQLESGLYEFQQVLGKDRGTLKGLEGALDKGKTTPVELAQNVKLVAKLLSEKVEVSQEQLTAVQEHLDPSRILHIAQFTASNGSLSDSGISDGATSDGGLSERERRLGVLRRLAKQLESALAPGSEAMKSIAARMESAEFDLKSLQNTCRDLIVRTAASHTKKSVQNGSGGDDRPPSKKNSPESSPSSKRRNKRNKKSAAIAAANLGESDAAAYNVALATSPDAGDPDDPYNEESLDFDSSDDENKTGKPGWVKRIAKIAFPMQVALFTLICAACMMQPNCCDNLNNLSMSFTPQLRYIRGPPPI